MLTVSISKATTIERATVEVYPSKGDITTEISVHVRGEPYSPSSLFGNYRTAAADYPRLYLYYDDICIVQRMACVTSPGIGDYSYYYCSWDVNVTVPNEYPYSELGLHNITAVVEASDSTTAVAITTFEVVNYFPPPKWWEDLPQEFIDEITGPQGPKGERGPQGEIGLQGEPGSYPIEVIILNLAISALSVIISIIALRKVQKAAV